MYEHALKAAPVRHIQNCEDVVYMAVHSAVGQKPHYMQRLIVFLRIVHCFDIRGIFKKVAVGYCLCYARQILKHDSARSDIGMTHLAVAHLTVGQTDVHSGGGKLSVSIPGKDSVKVRSCRRAYGVALGFRGNAEAVHNNKNRFTHCLHLLRK